MADGLTALLTARAEDLGAAAVGVADVETFARELDAMQESAATGRAGPLGFTYRNPELATDLRRSFPWARRVLVVAVDYLAEAASPSSSGPLVARFATSDHYQAVGHISSELRAQLHSAGHRAEALIDDNRLVDRAAAVRAGVGWAAKSTMVLTPGHGPWTLLGSVVTDAPLAPSQPMRRDCGTCTACYPACPTGALSDLGLDARRCLSTWLQTPGSMPRWIRPRLGRRIYGCDDCLTACPPGKPALSRAGESPLGLDFAGLLSLSDEDLVDRFGWWFVPRRDGRYLRRNLLVAAGNSGEPGAWPPLEAHLSHPSSMIRAHAYWAAARGFPERAGPALSEWLASETVPEARAELQLARLMVMDPSAHDAILAADEWVATDSDLAALAVMGKSGEPARIRLLALAHDRAAVPAAPQGWPGLEITVVPAGLAPAAPGPLIPVHDPDRLFAQLLPETAGRGPAA